MVLTSRPSDFEAIHQHIVDVKEDVHDEGTWITQGRLPDSPWDIALAELGEGGAVNTAVLTERITGWMRPEALFFVGVADSLRDHIRTGDVVVGTKVYAVQGGEQTPEGFLVHPQAWHASHRLQQAARFTLRGKVHLAPIAVADVVLSDARSAIAEFLGRHYGDAAAIETEGSGVAHAAHLSGQLDALVIRGIRGRADAGRALGADPSAQEVEAVEQAAAAVVAILRRTEPFRRRAGTSARSSEDSQEGPHRRPRHHRPPRPGRRPAHRWAGHRTAVRRARRAAAVPGRQAAVRRRAHAAGRAGLSRRRTAR